MPSPTSLGVDLHRRAEAGGARLHHRRHQLVVRRRRLVADRLRCPRRHPHHEQLAAVAGGDRRKCGRAGLAGVDLDRRAPRPSSNRETKMCGTPPVELAPHDPAGAVGAPARRCRPPRMPALGPASTVRRPDHRRCAGRGRGDRCRCHARVASPPECRPGPHFRCPLATPARAPGRRISQRQPVGPDLRLALRVGGAHRGDRPDRVGPAQERQALLGQDRGARSCAARRARRNVVRPSASLAVSSLIVPEHRVCPVGHDTDTATCPRRVA